MIWNSTNFGYEDRLLKILQGWKGTPYKEGSQVPKMGVDCVRFCCGVVDALFGFPRTTLNLLPADVALHDKLTALKAMRTLRRLYSPLLRVPTEPGIVEPGDLLVTGPTGGGPGHIIIVGPEKNTTWQATSQSVEKTGLTVPYRMDLFRIFRFEDRHKWVTQ